MFSTKEALSEGWRLSKQNLGFLLGVHAVAIAIQTVPQFLFKDSPGTQAAVVIGCMLLSFVVALGLVRIGLNVVDGEPSGYGDLFGSAHLVFKYLIASILYALIVLFGLILFVIPGCIWGAQFSQWPFLMVEREFGPIEALSESSKLTKGSRSSLILYYMALIGVVLLGVMAFLVGVIVSYAVCTVSMAYVYRQLLANVSSPDDSELTEIAS